MFKRLIPQRTLMIVNITKATKQQYNTNLNRAAMREDLPAPVRPTTPNFVRPGTVNDTSLQ